MEAFIFSCFAPFILIGCMAAYRFIKGLFVRSEDEECYQ